MDNRPSWVIKVVAALRRGQEAAAAIDAAYREAAETISIHMRLDNLTQTEVAEHLGRHRSYVSKILKWHQEGCAEGGPFAGEAARRRAAKRVATSQQEPWLRGGEVVIDGGREPNKAAILGANASCEKFAKAIDALTKVPLGKVFEGNIAMRRQALGALAKSLLDAQVSADRILELVDAALSDIELPPDFDEKFVPQDTSREDSNDPF